MKKQNSPIVIRYAVLMLMLGWTLVSSHIFAQNPSQKAYTTGTNANRVSQIDTATNMELQVPFPVSVFSPQGVDITYNNSDLVVSSSTACAPSNPCVTRIPIATGNPIPIPTGNGSQFVTVTPPIPNRGNCSFAYVTTGSANISEINLCDNSVRQPNIMLPGPGSPYSLGIAAAPLPDGTADVWVTDNNTNGKVFVFNTSITCPPPDQNGNCPANCVRIENPARCAPLATAVNLTCPPDCINTCCPPPNNAAPRHLAYIAISANQYRMYIPDFDAHFVH